MSADRPNRIFPPALRAGNTIGIVAPASGIRVDALEAGCRELESMGFRTHYRPDICAVDRYVAGSVQRRLSEFVSMIEDPSIHAVFAARGGYGSGQLVPNLPADLFRRHPKVLLGASDLTSLLVACDRAGVVSFHGPMVAMSIARGRDGFDRDNLLRLVTVPEPIAFPMDGVEVLRDGAAEGRITGGCLSLLVATIGTANEIDTDGTIFLIEDIDTKPYQIDRMITHLIQAGKFRGVRAVILGEMPGCKQNGNQGYALQDVIIDLLKDTDGPVVYGFPTGHASRPQLTVPVGVHARLSTRPLEFRLLEAAVR